ncbi:MAG: hypothetical protein HYZ75_07145 [Elusimicrobia bacterium]|nr:hypothetical protein [Elusimicrobiota bacterium]
MTYFFVVFLAYQTPLNIPRGSHTAAVFARTTADGRPVEAFTISWLPTRLGTDPREAIFLLQRPEPGRNYSVAETLEQGSVRSRQLRRWGPFQIRPEVYTRALERHHQLNSGRIQYTVLDHAARGAVNCIHALAGAVDAVPLVTGFKRGFAATRAVLGHFLGDDPQRRFVRYPVVHEWLSGPLGVAGVPHAAALPYRGSTVALSELESRGVVRRELAAGALFAPEVGVRLLPPEALTPAGWAPALPGPVSR